MNVPNTIDRFLDAGGSRSLGLKHISIDFLDAGGSRSASSFVSESVCAFHGGPPRDRWSCFLPVVLVAPVLEVVRNVHNGAAAVRLLLNVLLHLAFSSRDYRTNRRARRVHCR